jgi:uncharacterized protein
MKLLGPEDLAQLVPAATHAFAGPAPTQNVSSDEYMPRPQTPEQRNVEVRLIELADQLAKKQRMSRRRFFQTASGMAVAYLVMNEVYGSLFAVSRAEAATPEHAEARSRLLRDQFIMDLHTHHLHEPLPPDVFDMFLGMRKQVRDIGWNPEIPNGPGTCCMTTIEAAIRARDHHAGATGLAGGD